MKNTRLLLSVLWLLTSVLWLAPAAHAAKKNPKTPDALKSPMPAGMTPVTAASPTLPATTPAATDAAPVSSRAPLKMTGEVIGKIDHRFFGANLLYWIDTKKDLADDRFKTLLKDLPVTVLRYPGGTVADNFHWKTTTLDNPNRFPYETRGEMANRTTFDDFMALCARTGAAPLVVVNTESWVLHNDIEGGIKEAADWVRYCKEKNYKVPYWAIGNETYWHPIMTAREYGALVKRYSQAMKAVDPSIKIGANGHWEVQQIGVKDNFPRSQWDSIRQRTLAIAKSKDDADLKAEVKANRGAATGEKNRWWNNVLEECGQDIDMLCVHWYMNIGTVSKVDSKLAELMKFAKAKTGRDYILAMTEYNCNSANEANGWGLAEGVCRMFNGGATLGTFWPMRYPGESGRRSMITTGRDLSPRYAYQILKLFSDNFGGDIIKCTAAPASNLFMFATKTPEQITLVITARGHDKNSAASGDYDIAFDADAAKGKVTSVSSFATDTTPVLHQATPKYTLKKNGLTLRIEPGTFTMVIIKR